MEIKLQKSDVSWMKDNLHSIQQHIQYTLISNIKTPATLPLKIVSFWRQQFLTEQFKYLTNVEITDLKMANFIDKCETVLKKKVPTFAKEMDDLRITNGRNGKIFIKILLETGF